jgi:hypothetical protein
MINQNENSPFNKSDQINNLLKLADEGISNINIELSKKIE